MNLVQLAEERSLPLLQNLDSDSLQWIKENEPNELKGISVSSIAKSIDVEKISRFVPLSSWFTSESKVNSLHGGRHLMRVTAYSYFLGLSLNEEQRNSLLVAASLHDIRRLSDKADEGHAERVASWYRENEEEILRAYGVNEVDSAVVFSLIKLHEQAYGQLKTDTFYLSNRKLVDILKTSDALDRYIQPKIKWWLKEHYLNLIPSQEMKAFAFNLALKSENKYLNTFDSKEAVLSSLKELQS